MKGKYISILILLLAVVAMDIAVIAREYATEAPAGFDTPTLAQNPGSQSISDGIAQPPGDTYALDQTKFEQDHDASTGFGARSEEHTSELQSRLHLVCRLLLEKKNKPRLWPPS